MYKKKNFWKEGVLFSLILSSTTWGKGKVALEEHESTSPSFSLNSHGNSTGGSESREMVLTSQEIGDVLSGTAVPGGGEASDPSFYQSEGYELFEASSVDPELHAPMNINSNTSIFSLFSHSQLAGFAALKILDQYKLPKEKDPPVDKK